MSKHAIFLCSWVVITLGSTTAQDSCFWELPGTKEILAGAEWNFSPPADVPCSPPPGLLSQVGPFSQSPFHVTVFAYEHGLFVSAGSIEQALCMCCIPIVFLKSPYELSLPDVEISKVTALALSGLRIHNDTVSTRLLLSVADNQIVSYELRMGVYEATRGVWVSEPVPFTLEKRTTNQRIRGLAEVPDSNVVIAFGDGGLLRRITMSGNPQETVLDVDSTESLLCAGDGFVGSASGNIYRIGENTPVARVTGTLRTVSSIGAGGDDGLVVERVGDRWNAYDAGDMSVRHIRFTEEWYGVEAHIVDERYQMHHVTIHDSVTRLIVESPQQLAGAFEAGEFSYSGPDTLRAGFRLHDAENNHTQPTIALRTIHGDTNIAPQLNGEYVERCEDYSKGLMRHQFDLVLSRDSVIFTANCFYQTFVHICSETCYPRSFDCRSSVKWTRGDTVRIAVDLDTLDIIHSSPSAARPERTINSGSADFPRMLESLRHGVAPPGVENRVEVYTLDGQRLPLSGSQTKVLPRGTYLYRLIGVDGYGATGRFWVAESR